MKVKCTIQALPSLYLYQKKPRNTNTFTITGNEQNTFVERKKGGEIKKEPKIQDKTAARHSIDPRNQVKGKKDFDVRPEQTTVVFISSRPYDARVTD